MGKKFYGVIVSYTIVSTWYNNPDHPDFDSFIFQQQNDTSTTAKKDYTLIAYPVDVNGKVLSGASVIEGLPGTKNKSIKGDLVNYANMKLDKTALSYLYPKDCTSDLEINPTENYKTPNGLTTNYMAYEAVTYADKLAIVKRPVNPSPPA